MERAHVGKVIKKKMIENARSFVGDDFFLFALLFGRRNVLEMSQLPEKVSAFN